MQVFIRRLGCCFCVFLVIVSLLVPQIVSAAENETDIWDGTSITNFGDGFVILHDLIEWGAYVALAQFSDAFQGVSGSDLVVLMKSPFYCDKADSITNGSYKSHLFEGTSPSIRYRYCKYCGLSGADWLAEMQEAQDEFVSDLSGGLPLSFNLTCYYENSRQTYSVMAAHSPSSGITVTGDLTSSSSIDLSSRGAWDGSTAVFYNHDYRYCAASFSSGPITLQAGEYTIPSFSYSSNYPGHGVLGTYDKAFRLIRYDPSDRSETILWERYVRTDTAGNDADHIYTGTIPDITFAAVPTCEYYFGFSCSFDVPGVDYSSFFTLNDVVQIVPSDSVDAEIYDPTDIEQAADEKYSEDTRVSALMEYIEWYNQENSYKDDSNAVNVGLVEQDVDGSILAFLSPFLFDEETLIFTEPVTGAQYQCTGWTYDYSTRSYDISMSPGTFMIGDRDVCRIVCTYSDEAVTIEYYDESGLVLLESKSYKYGMIASNPCALQGHSYSIISTQEPTCTSVGERVYSCSVCGDQKVEDIPMKEHAHVYSEVKQASCTDPGYGIYTCSTCGGQFTETIEPLGHDWLSTEVVDTSYSLPPGAVCPDCSGTEFTWELDELNAMYSCTCSSCERVWEVNAEVTPGYTAYTCSRCGEKKVEQEGDAGDGLFKSIGNFIADGITWCTEKLTELVDSLTTIIDTFNEYLDKLPQSGNYPSFLGAFLEALPEELTAIIWLAVISFIVIAVIKIGFR